MATLEQAQVSTKQVPGFLALLGLVAASLPMELDPAVHNIAILAAGYGDGLPRHLENGTPVLIGGSRHPLVGRVSMDMIAVDVTGAPKVATGSRAIIWGEGLPVEEVATHADTIPYELLCGVSQRVPLELK